MFAVIRTGGKQYKVAANDVIVVEKLVADLGASVDLPDILMVSDGATTAVGRPTVDGAKVAATVVNQERADKITVLKFKRRQGYRRTIGHRQHGTVLRITEISAPGMQTAKAEPKEKKARSAEDADKKPAKKAPAKKAPAKKAAAKKTAPAKKPAKKE